MAYRTKTYIAGVWDEDAEVIQQLYKWKDSEWRTFDFVDAHDVTQARDSSLNCSIKRSLKTRLDMSKTFVLVVGNNTKSNRAGGCQYCSNYHRNIYSQASCNHDYSVDYSSYIEYECEQAVKANMKIVVIYNSYLVNKDKCPDILQRIGKHISAHTLQGYWNYNEIRDAICG